MNVSILSADYRKRQSEESFELARQKLREGKLEEAEYLYQAANRVWEIDETKRFLFEFALDLRKAAKETAK